VHCPGVPPGDASNRLVTMSAAAASLDPANELRGGRAGRQAATLRMAPQTSQRDGRQHSRQENGTSQDGAPAGNGGGCAWAPARRGRRHAPCRRQSAGWSGASAQPPAPPGGFGAAWSPSPPRPAPHPVAERIFVIQDTSMGIKVPAPPPAQPCGSGAAWSPSLRLVLHGYVRRCAR